jgi:hypothetical protein
MSSGDQKNVEFASGRSYLSFARSVLRSRRYVMEDKELRFLEAVLATVPEREKELVKGRLFYRAQLGVDWRELTDEEGNFIGEEVLGYGSARMKPLADRAREGRANSTGIPSLYVADTIETAISEVRPWLDAEISVATCRLTRPLRTLDLSVGYGQSSSTAPILKHALGGPEPTREEKKAAVWIDIDNAFSKPVTASDDKADYAPTQILTELFKSAGYEAIAYKSHFGDDEKKTGHNLAIFDLDAIEIVSCSPFSIKSINVEAKQTGNARFMRKT